MSEDKTSEMSPNEEGAKIISDKSPDEAKFVVEKNGDAKIDIGKAPQVSGLTKEELMKYADDPFWVRLRWSLFIFFWAGWLAMLVVAIVVIVQAPGCEPPPELKWVQESAIIEIDPTAGLPSEADLVKQCKDQQVSSVFLPDFISEDDFQESNYDATSLIGALTKGAIGAIAELPVRMSRANPMYTNFTAEGLINSDGTLNYAASGLGKAMYELLASFWITAGVKGFLMKEASTYEIDMFVEEMNSYMEEEEGALGNDIREVKDEIGRSFDVERLRTFLEQETGNWSYYQFNPSYQATSSGFSADDIRLMDIAFYLFPATPIHPFGSSDNETDLMIRGLANLRTQDGIKFGETSFANASSNVLGYTRIYKGTPAYAVALNFGSADETVDFSNTKNVAEDGTLELKSNKNETQFSSRSKVPMNGVSLAPYEGKVMQFVANFD